MSVATASSTEKAWYEAYPPAQCKNPASITATELLHALKQGKKPGVDFILVDLRRNDHEGGTIKGSLNLPAQSLHQSLPTLYALCLAAGAKQVIWWCASSKGRGTRAAGWFDDYIREQKGERSLQSLVLEGGITGWANGGKEYVECMADYDADFWQRPKESRSKA
ncbi:MAG: hypothetical protein LQ346_004918 [Caloplaca aetnensis]|nr:MAG: hypothetical protein LQ346_004918 [Caloplaca aetnensis]